tara:strand:- start:85 stop:522 length:438 start_codon:yes stop_codon:yes gene_type:complete
MYKPIIYIILLFFAYSCAPIQKQHGYSAEDLFSVAADVTALDEKSHKNDILAILGSPSVKIDDIDDIWIYLLSIKEEKVFERDDINYQQIWRFSFNSSGYLTKTLIYNEDNYNEIAFSKEKTTITRDAYSISDQIYDAFTRGATR